MRKWRRMSQDEEKQRMRTKGREGEAKREGRRKKQLTINTSTCTNHHEGPQNRTKAETTPLHICCSSDRSESDHRNVRQRSLYQLWKSELSYGNTVDSNLERSDCDSTPYPSSRQKVGMWSALLKSEYSEPLLAVFWSRNTSSWHLTLILRLSPGICLRAKAA